MVVDYDRASDRLLNLISKLSTTDMIALRAKYHLSCLADLVAVHDNITIEKS